MFASFLSNALGEISLTWITVHRISHVPTLVHVYSYNAFFFVEFSIISVYVFDYSYLFGNK